MNKNLASKSKYESTWYDDYDLLSRAKKNTEKFKQRVFSVEIKKFKNKMKIQTILHHNLFLIIFFFKKTR